MDWMTFSQACTAVGLLAGGVVGVLTKSYVDNKVGSRKQYLDQLQVAIQDTRDLRKELNIQGGQIHNLQEKILDLSVAKMKLETENIGFRRDITDLQRQIQALGHEPVVGPVEMNGAKMT